MSSKHTPDTPSTTTNTISRTDCVNTATSGTIHGTRIEAFQIIAGSTFPVDNDALARISPGNAEDETTFNVAIDPESIDVHPKTGTDVFITGVYEEFFTPTGHNQNRTRTSFQAPYDARRPFQNIRRDNSLHAEFTDGTVPRWNIDNTHDHDVIRALLERGFPIVARLDTIRNIVSPHPEHTVNSDGEFIITDRAQMDPDYYETDEPRPEAGHGNGGNPHDITYFLQHGECPAANCTETFETFRSLRGHIGGKCGWETEDSHRHEQLNLRLNEVTVATDEPGVKPAD